MSGVAPLSRWIAPACAILLIATSFALDRSWLRTAEAVRVWEADDLDPADYRLTAEHFWGVHADPSTYTFGPLWRPEWASYLTMVPFRQIGTGTAYLVIGWLRHGHAPHTPNEVAQAGQLLVASEELLLALGLLAVFRAVAEPFGPSIALASLAALVFPPRMWRLTDDLMTEPLLRIVLLFVFAAAVRFAGTRRRVDAIAIATWLMVAVHIKVQWLVAVALLLPALMMSEALKVQALSLVLAVFMVAAPLSVVAVNWIGWRTTSIASGTGIHAHLKYGDSFLRAFCAQRADPPRFCEQDGPRLRWWNMKFEGTRQDYEAFDRFAARDVVTHPLRTASQFIEGLALASAEPGTEQVGPDGLRLVDYSRPWDSVISVVDRLVWTLLVIGLWMPSTRLMAWTAIVMWVVPAFGNVIAVYELRYHQPMAGVALATALIVAFECRHRVSWRDFSVPRRLRHTFVVTGWPPQPRKPGC